MRRMARWLAVALALLLLPLIPAVAEEAAEKEAVLMVRCGGSFVIAIDREGRIWGWGDNRKGQAAYEKYQLVKTPQPVATNLDGFDVADIQCGNENTLFLMKDGTVYVCGAGDHGRLGNKGMKSSAKEPILVPGLSNIVAIDCGFGQSMALDSSGHVWGWGKNSESQVGVEVNGKPRQTVEEPVDLGLENIVQIGCGGRYSMALDADGTLYLWGENDNGQMMANPRKQSIVLSPTAVELPGHTITQIAAGGDTGYFLDDEGHVWAWGRNDRWQCGNDTVGNQVTEPVRVLIPDEEKVVRVIAYSSHTMAITDEGKLWMWGHADTGELGNGTHPSRSLPVVSCESGVIDGSVGSLCCALLLEDGTIMCTGYNAWGQLGIGTRTRYDWTFNGLNLLTCTLEPPTL